jgi:hypothetical protein
VSVATHDTARYGEAGISLVGTLLVVIILGALAGIALSQTTSSPPSTRHGGTTVPSTTPKDVGSDASAASLASCEANFTTVESAVESYLAMNGAKPPAGTAWATAGAGGPLLEAWPQVPSQYAISWNGEVLSVVPAHGTPSHGSYGTATPRTGCYAVR